MSRTGSHGEPYWERPFSRQTIKIFITRAISIINLVVASSALMFQVCVLYPWHKQLDDDFGALKNENLRLLNSIEASDKNTGDAKPKLIRNLLGSVVSWR